MSDFEELSDKKTTHFGYQQINADEKVKKVADVFHSVASKYDLMNDLMSLGLHRLWKRIAVKLCHVRPNQVILDLAGGTGDLSYHFSRLVGDKGKIILADINESMIHIGRQRLINKGIVGNIEYVEANAECLPFNNNTFHRVCIGFGLRNVTDKEKALKEMYRVLKPGGQSLILEFSTPTLPLLKPIYDAYSFSILPNLGKFFAGDSDSYRYLAESIRMHPNQATLKTMMQDNGFEDVNYANLSGGIVAVHKGFKY